MTAKNLPRHVHVLSRVEVKPCKRYPNGVPSYTLTTFKTEAESHYWQNIVTATHTGFDLYYICSKETLQ